MTRPRSVLVVGAGLAGSRCAETLRAEGFDGRVTVVGAETVPPYERPALSKEFLARRREADSLSLRPASFWQECDIELVLGTRVLSVDHMSRTATTDGARHLRWDALVLATGARARRLPIAAPPGVHVLRTLEDATALRRELVHGRRLVVVGSGFVGAEVASTARELGVEVTLLEAGAEPFGQLLGADVGRLLAARYRACGVDLRTGTQARAFGSAGDGRLRATLLSDGEYVQCDVALLAVGMEPANELVTPSAGANVHACGDVARGGGHWTSAATSAVETARRILGLEPLPQQPPFFWSDQFGLRLQLVGDPRAATAVKLDGTEDRFVARYVDAGGRSVAALAANRPDEVGSLRRELALAA